MPSKKPLSAPLLIVIAVVVAFVLVIAVIAVYLRSAPPVATKVSGSSAPSPRGPPSLSAVVSAQDMLYFGKTADPYLLVRYDALNASQLSANATIFSSAVPSSIFILNTDNECFSCGDVSAIDAAIVSNLLRYGVISNSSAVQYVNASELGSLPPDSMLIVLNGLLPDAFLSPAGNGNPLLVSLLNSGVSVLYVGQDFSRALLPGSVVVPSNLTAISFLETHSAQAKTSSGYYFNRSTFSFTSGTDYGAITYVSIYNGSVIAFSNSPSSWGSAGEAGHDIALAIAQLFWLPSYSRGHESAGITSASSSGSLGMVLSPYSPGPGSLSAINNGTIVVSLEASGQSSNSSGTAYSYIRLSPHFSINGSITVPQLVIPGSTVPVTMTVFTHSAAMTSIQPHITVYTLNMLPVSSIPLPFTNASGNFTFIQYINFGIGPGNYVAMLQSFNNAEQAAALFSVSPISIAVSSANLGKGLFTFSVTSDGQPLSDIGYGINLNGAYPSNGTISNGTLTYALPSGTPLQQGRINFVVSIMGEAIPYTYSTPTTVITINKQYIEIGIDVMVALVIVLFIRAPNRDEFYIDVPSLPAPQKTTIKLKPDEVVSAFGKLNMSYRWRFMPLSLPEVHAAIMGNIRYNNIPVSLTYANIEALLSQLTVGGYLIASDNLYAPKTWEQQSGHDIEYLSTFKKLRLYLVTHSYMFTDLDASTTADIIATLHGEHKYLVVCSGTSKFKNVPVIAGSKTYLVFLNSYRLEEFRNNMYAATGADSEKLKAYVSAGVVHLVDADSPDEISS
jgi:hypothetical protein